MMTIHLVEAGLLVCVGTSLTYVYDKVKYKYQWNRLGKIQSNQALRRELRARMK